MVSLGWIQKEAEDTGSPPCFLWPTYQAALAPGLLFVCLALHIFCTQLEVTLFSVVFTSNMLAETFTGSIYLHFPG